MRAPRGEKSLFSFSENVPKLSYSNAEFQNFPGDNTPTFVSGIGKFFFVLRKFTETLLYSNAEFTNSPGIIVPRTPVLGERKVCFRSPKMYQNSPIQQCRIQKKKSGVETPDPVFGNGRGKLPPLEIVSGYASDRDIIWNRFNKAIALVLLLTFSESRKECWIISRDLDGWLQTSRKHLPVTKSWSWCRLQYFRGKISSVLIHMYPENPREIRVIVSMRCCNSGSWSYKWTPWITTT